MSRAMKADEIDEFEKKFGYKPTALRDARSTCSRSTSTRTTRSQSLTLQQVDAIFSKTRKGGARQGHPHLGRPRPDRRVGEQADQPLRPQLGLGHLRLLQGARALQGRLQGHRQGAAGQLGGRAGRRRATSTASATAASATRPPTCARCRSPRRRAASSSRPTPEQRLRGRVPARALPLRLRQLQARAADSIRCAREFVRYVFSKQGQEAVVKDGYFPVTASDRRRRRSKALGLAGARPATPGRPAGEERDPASEPRRRVRGLHAAIARDTARDARRRRVARVAGSRVARLRDHDRRHRHDRRRHDDLRVPRVGSSCRSSAARTSSAPRAARARRRRDARRGRSHARRSTSTACSRWTLDAGRRGCARSAVATDARSRERRGSFAGRRRRPSRVRHRRRPRSPSASRTASVRVGTHRLRVASSSTPDALPEPSRRSAPGERATLGDGACSCALAATASSAGRARVDASDEPRRGRVERRGRALDSIGALRRRGDALCVAADARRRRCVLERDRAHEEPADRRGDGRASPRRRCPTRARERRRAARVLLRVSERGDLVYLAWARRHACARFDCATSSSRALAEERRPRRRTRRDAHVRSAFLIGRTTLIVGRLARAACAAGSGRSRRTRRHADGIAGALAHELAPHAAPRSPRSRRRRATRLFADGRRDGTRARRATMTSEQIVAEASRSARRAGRARSRSRRRTTASSRSAARRARALSTSTRAHPEVALARDLRPVWYEGYAGPAHVWQSSAGTRRLRAQARPRAAGLRDAQGDVLLAALRVPLALLAALYTSEFLHPRVARARSSRRSR